MKFIFYYHHRDLSPKEKMAPGGSFGAHARDLIRGLETLGHKCLDVPYDISYTEKEKIYQDYKADKVVFVDSWLRCLDNMQHAVEHSQNILPFLVSDLHCNWITPKTMNFLNTTPQIIVPSEWVKSNFVRDGYTGRISIIKESVDTNRFCPQSDSSERVRIRSKYNIKPNDIMVLTVAGEMEEKGGYEIIEALKVMNRKDIRYVVKVWKKEGRINQKLLNNEEFVAKSGISDQITLIKDVLSQEEIISLYQSCDIYAAPSHNEGFGRPHIEAQACGVPVITLGGSAAGENVIHMNTGYVARIGQILYSNEIDSLDNRNQIIKGFVADIKDLVKGFSILSGGNTRQSMGIEARKYILNNFTTEIISNQFINAITIK